MTDQWAIFAGRTIGGGNVDCVHKSLIEEGIRMIQNRLRLYCGPDASGTASVAETKQTPKDVTLPAGEVFAWLADAAQNSRAWLRDFEDDQITISSDLYEVILAYQHFRRPSA